MITDGQSRVGVAGLLLEAKCWWRLLLDINETLKGGVALTLKLR